MMNNTYLLTGIALLLIAGAVFIVPQSLDTGGTVADADQSERDQPTVVDRTDNAITGVVIKNEIVKKDSEECAYYFDIRNRTDALFSGTVEITLHGLESQLAQETFTTGDPLQIGEGLLVHIDTASCTPAAQQYRYRIFSGDMIIARGEDPVTEKIYTGGSDKRQIQINK